MMRRSLQWGGYGLTSSTTEDENRQVNAGLEAAFGCMNSLLNLTKSGEISFQWSPGYPADAQHKFEKPQNAEVENVAKIPEDFYF
jgi:hypothetical protein